jgi:glutaminyl-peptide cyclotransferase
MNSGTHPTLRFFFAAALLLLSSNIITACQPAVPVFDGQRAYQDVAAQIKLGPRIPGTPAHAAEVEWIQSELKKAGWSTEVQETSALGHPVRNVIGKRGSGQPWIILGAHFDSRMKADQDPNPAKRSSPVPGANDGASGVAILLELARALPSSIHSQVWLAFFDAEDQGDLAGWDWILGSRALAASLTGKPDAVVIVDMVGDANLNIYKERSSNPALTQAIWESAAQAGYAGSFLPEYRYSMLDDHTPFLQKGIPAVDLIDFDFPAWHTTADTLDQVSAASLKAVGETLLQWILSRS